MYHELIDRECSSILVSCTSFGVDLQCGIFDHLLSVLVTMWSALPDVKVRDREEIKNGLDVLLVFCRIIA